MLVHPASKSRRRHRPHMPGICGVVYKKGPGSGPSPHVHTVSAIDRSSISACASRLRGNVILPVPLSTIGPVRSLRSRLNVLALIAVAAALMTCGGRTTAPVAQPPTDPVVPRAGSTVVPAGGDELSRTDATFARSVFSRNGRLAFPEASRGRASTRGTTGPVDAMPKSLRQTARARKRSIRVANRPARPRSIR